MIKQESGKLDYANLLLPFGLLLLGLALVIYSVPGQGKNLPNAIGLLLVLVGVIGVHRVRAKRTS
jgi:hypothetical protein